MIVDRKFKINEKLNVAVFMAVNFSGCYMPFTALK